VQPNLKDLHGQAAPQQGGHSAYTTDGASHAENEYAQLPPLKRKIIEFIMKEPNTTDGVHIQVILRGVGGDMDSLKCVVSLGWTGCSLANIPQPRPGRLEGGGFLIYNL
jgi:hypothetical protein